MAIKLDYERVAHLPGLDYFLAHDLLAVYPTAESLVGITPEILRVTVRGFREVGEMAVEAVLAYAEGQLLNAAAHAEVEELGAEDGLDELFTQALNLWVAKGLEKVPGQTVLLGQNESAVVTIRRLAEPGCFCFAIRRMDSDFSMDVKGVVELQGALVVMGTPFVRLSAWRVIQQLKLFAERYKPAA